MPQLTEDAIKLNISTLRLNNNNLLNDLYYHVSNILSLDQDIIERYRVALSDAQSKTVTGRTLSPLPLPDTLAEYHAGRVSYEKLRANMIEIRLLLRQLPPEDGT